MSVSLGVLAIVAAAFLQWKPIGPDAFAKRVAAVLALGGIAAVVNGTVLGAKARQLTAKAVELAAEPAARLDPNLGQAVRDDLATVIFGILVILWVAAMITSRVTRWGGSIFGQEFDTLTTWGGGIAIAVFATTLPGGIGQLGTSARDVAVTASTSVAQAVFS
jgi:hypothetical protein